MDSLTNLGISLLEERASGDLVATRHRCIGDGIRKSIPPRMDSETHLYTAMTR